MKREKRSFKCYLTLLSVLVFLVMMPVKAEASSLSKTSTGAKVTASTSTDSDKIFSIEEAVDARIKKGFVVAKVKDQVNVRENPNKDSKKVGVLYKGCGGSTLASKDGWTKIQSGDVVGWVNNDYLYIGKEAREIAIEVGILVARSTTDNLRVRREPSMEGKKIGELDKDEEVEAVSVENGWVEVNYEGNTGYVSSDYVVIEFDIDEAETLEQKKEREKAEELAKRMEQIEYIKESASDVDILAALIQCEAGGEPYEGKIAVGAVVMNRVKCPAYPDSIRKVIYASKQFTPSTSKKMTNLILKGNIKESCKQAAIEAINGATTVGSALNFRTAGKREGIIIGNQVFW